MSYWTLGELQAFVGAPTVQALLDDDNAGVIDTAALLEIQQLSDGMVDGGLARVFPGPFPLTQTPAPVLVRQASLLWAKALLFERHPEYVRRYGEGPRKTAEAFLDRLIAAREYLTDALNMSTKPGNVGGLVTDSGPRMTINNADGSSNTGDF